MSFITLKSTLHNNYVSSSESAATWTNNFEVPIVLGPGNTLQLVPCSIKKTLGYTVNSNNNTLYWRIGVGAFDTGTPAQLLSTPYEALQHKVTIANGVYTGDELAVEIAYQLNKSTIIGMFKGLWTCIYTEVAAGSAGTKFDIKWDQATTPPETADINGLLMSPVYDKSVLLPMVGGVTQAGGADALPTPPFQPTNVFKFTTPTNVNSGGQLRQLNTELVATPEGLTASEARAYEELSLGYLGDRSVFANGGAITNIIRPTCYIDDYIWIRAGPVDTIVFSNWNNVLMSTVTGTVVATPPGPVLTNQWKWTITVPALTVPAGPFYMFTDAAGCVGITDDGTKAANEKNSNFGFFKAESDDAVAYSNTAYLVQLDDINTAATPSPSALDPLMTIHADLVMTPLQIVYDTTYIASQTAFVRSSLQNPDNFTDVYQNYSADPGEADVQVNLITNATNTGVKVDIWYMNDQTGIAFPTPGWRNGLQAIAGLDLAGALAAASPGFVFGQSSIRVDIKISSIKDILVTIAHNGPGDDAAGFGTETIITNSGLLAGNLPLRPIEAHYPLRPFLSTGTGLPFVPLAPNPQVGILPYTGNNGGLAQQYIAGQFDTFVTSQDGLDLFNINLNPTTSSLIPPPAGIVGPVDLPFLFKAGNINADDIYFPPAAGSITTISTNDVIENQANIMRLIAFNSIHNETTPAPTHTASSNTDIAPEITGNRSTIQVEVPDFNIESWSGESTDKGRAVGVIPSEEWTTGDRTGVLHYQSQYPRPIDLNLPFSKPFYSLQCRLRDLDGRLVQGLDHSTELVLLVGTSEESKQQKIMDKSMERLANLVANKQESRISQPFDGSRGI